MSRYVEHAGNVLGVTIVHAMWEAALTHAQVISTDATGALINSARSFYHRRRRPVMLRCGVNAARTPLID